MVGNRNFSWRIRNSSEAPRNSQTAATVWDHTHQWRSLPPCIPWSRAGAWNCQDFPRLAALYDIWYVESKIYSDELISKQHKNPELSSLIHLLYLTLTAKQQLLSFLNTLTGTDVDKLVDDAMKAPIGDHQVVYSANLSPNKHWRWKFQLPLICQKSTHSSNCSRSS